MPEREKRQVNNYETVSSGLTYRRVREIEGRTLTTLADRTCAKLQYISFIRTLDRRNSLRVVWTVFAEANRLRHHHLASSPRSRIAANVPQHEFPFPYPSIAPTNKPSLNQLHTQLKKEMASTAKKLISTLTLAGARTAVSAAGKRAQEIGVPMNVAVVDSACHLQIGRAHV